MRPNESGVEVTTGQLHGLQLELAMALTVSLEPATIVRAFLHVLIRTLACRRAEFVSAEGSRSAAGVRVPRSAPPWPDEALLPLQHAATPGPHGRSDGYWFWQSNHQLAHGFAVGTRGWILLEMGQRELSLVVRDALRPMFFRLATVLTSTEALQALTASQDRYRGLVERLSEAVLEGCVSRSGDLQLLWVSDQVTGLLGLSPADLVHNPMRLFEGTEPTERSAFQAALRAALTHQEHDGAEIEFSRPTPSGDGVRVFRLSLTLSEPTAHGDVPCSGLLRDVSEQHRARTFERALERNRFASILRASPDAILAADASGRVEVINPVATKLLGLPQDGVIGARIEQFVRLEIDGARWALPSTDDLRGQRSVVLPDGLQVVSFDGGRRRVEGTVAPVRIGSVDSGLVVTLRDVTEAVALQEDLDRQNRRLRSMSEAMPDMIFSVGRDGRILYAPERPRPDLLSPPAALVGSTIAEHFPPGDPVVVRLLAAIGRALDGSHVETVEYGIGTPIGEQAFEARLVHASAEECIVVIRNVTREREQQSVLIDQQQKLEALLAGTGAILYSLRWPTLEVEFVSESVTTALGFSPSEMCSSGFWFQCVHPDDQPRLTATAEDLLKESVRIDEYRHRHRDGDYRWLRSELRVVRNKDGVPERVLGASFDITERRREEARREAVAKLQASISGVSRAFLDQFVSVDDALQSVLAVLGSMAHAERSYIMRLRNGLLSNTHEWCAEGVEPQSHNLQNLPMADYEWTIERFHRAPWLFIRQVDELPDEAAAERAVLSAQGIHALLIVPLRIDGALSGFVGVDNPLLDELGVEEIAQLLGLLNDAIEAGERHAEDQKRILEQRALLRAVVDSPDDIAIFALGNDGTYLDLNVYHRHSMQSAWGRAPEIGDAFLQVFPKSMPTDRLVHGISAALRGETTRYALDHPGNGVPDGGTYAAISGPIFNSDGGISGVTCFVADVSEQQRQAEVIAIRAKQQQALLSLGSELTACRREEETLAALRRHFPDVMRADVLYLTRRHYDRPHAVVHTIHLSQLAMATYNAIHPVSTPLDDQTSDWDARENSAVRRAFDTHEMVTSSQDDAMETPDWADFILEAGRGSSTVFPLVGTEGVLGTIHVGIVGEQTVDEADLQWWRQVSSVLASHLEALEARARLDEVNRGLEERIERRTNELNASLDESRTLLREIHHRVKNNLQIISSLLMMQSRIVSDAATRETLRESVHRVRSIALLHEFLYGSRSLSHVDMSRYIQRLSSFLGGALAPGAIVELDLQPVSVRLETAVPLGLVVNELVTNALKYGAPEPADPASSCGAHVRVSLTYREAEQKLVLLVSDTGRGFAPSSHSTRAAGLGLTLIESLRRQLRGDLRTWNDNGAHFEFSLHLDDADWDRATPVSNSVISSVPPPLTSPDLAG